MTIAVRTRITGNYTAWYSAGPLSEMSEVMVQYFQDKRERGLNDPKNPGEYVIFNYDEDTVSFCTQYESAKELELETAVSEKTGRVYLKTTPVISDEELVAVVAARRKKMRDGGDSAKPRTTVGGDASDAAL